MDKLFDINKKLLSKSLKREIEIVGIVDPLLDRDCVLLDGRCNCKRPVTEHCKYVDKNKK